MDKGCEHIWRTEELSIPMLALVSARRIQATCEYCGEERMFRAKAVKLGPSLHILFEEEESDD